MWNENNFCKLQSELWQWRHFFRSISFKSLLSIFILTLLTLLCLTAQSLLLPVVSISSNKIEAFSTFSASWTIWWVREEILSITANSPPNHLVWNHNSIRQTQISFCSRDLQEVLCCSLDYRRLGNVAVGGSSTDDVCHKLQDKVPQELRGALWSWIHPLILGKDCLTICPGNVQKKAENLLGPLFVEVVIYFHSDLI